MEDRSNAKLDRTFMENEVKTNTSVENKLLRDDKDGHDSSKKNYYDDNDDGTTIAKKMDTNDSISKRRKKFFLILIMCCFIVSIIIWVQASIVTSGRRNSNSSGGDGTVRLIEEQVWIGDSFFDMIGRSLALSKDGSILAMGGRNLLQIYEKRKRAADDDDEVWTLMEGGNIRQSEEEFNQSNLGAGVALSENGFVAAVCGDFYRGLIRVYDYQTTVHLDRDDHDTSNSRWVRKGTDIVNPTGDVGFESISLSSDGNTLLVSSIGDTDFPNDNAKDSESIYIYKFYNDINDWKLQQKIEHAKGTYGFSLSMTNQAHRFALGAKYNQYAAVYELQPNNDNIKGTNNGTNHNATTYKLLSGISGRDDFGYDVALNSLDGTVLAVGMPNMNNFRGGAMIYHYDSSYQQYIGKQVLSYHPTAHNHKQDFISINGAKEQIKPFEMGHAIDLSGDASVLVMAPNYEKTFVQVYHNKKDSKGDEKYHVVSQMENIIPAGRYTQIALSQNGKYLAVGLSDDGPEGPDRGQVTMYSLHL